METAVIEVPVTIAKTSINTIEKRDYFVVEGISEIGVFVQYLPIELKDEYDEDVAEYVMLFELKKDKNKHGLRVVGLTK